jgi:hypothetical protein
VNSENRGVVVIVPRLASVKIGWDDFDEVTFSGAPKSGRSYADYATARPLIGHRGHPGWTLGRPAGFDLDESRTSSCCRARMASTEYLIPFREIARIQPEGRRRRSVELKMGLTVELEGSQDVTLDNDGCWCSKARRSRGTSTGRTSTRSCFAESRLLRPDGRRAASHPRPTSRRDPASAGPLRALLEEPLAASEHQRVDHQPVLVDHPVRIKSLTIVALP